MAPDNSVKVYDRHRPIITLGAGTFYVDRFHDNGGVRGSEIYMGDTTAAGVQSTVQKTTVHAGDGSIGRKLIDRNTEISRMLTITCQDMTLENLALFLMSSGPETQGAGDAAVDMVTTLRVPLNANARTYYQLGTGVHGANPAGRPKFVLQNEPIARGGWLQKNIGALGEFAVFGDPITADDYILDQGRGRLAFTDSGLAKVRGKEVQITIVAAKIDSLPEFARVEVGTSTEQVRVAVRYIEESDEGEEGRNLYIPRCVLSPNGELALKSRNDPQRLPLGFSIETPESGLALMYVDGVPR